MHSTGEIYLHPFRGLRLKTFSTAFALTILLRLPVCAQFFDDFSDGNFNENPSWNGMSGNFMVNANRQLQLNANSAGSSWLSTEFSASAEEALQWEFFVKQSFAPSGANFGRIYLASDTADLSAALNGYYLQFGEAGSGDAVELLVQSGNETAPVCRATNGSISAAFEIGVKVTRQGARWELYVDYGGGTDYVLEATGLDDTHTASSFFGVACTYTVTNATRFYFDNISIRKSIIPDTTPPQITSLIFVSSDALNVCFNEEVERAGAEDPLHYVVSTNDAHPLKAVLQADGRTVALTFEQAFLNGYEIALSVEGVADLAGNVMATARKTILYFVPFPVNFGDVVITEIFADPVPRIGLPESEFVEVFNRSANPVQLEGWQFGDARTSGTLPSAILLPDHYIVICASSHVAEFNGRGPALASSNFPTLNNDEDRLTLLNAEAVVIDSVHYSAAWYKDEEKAAGGWTLERIDTDNFCAKERNWVASDDPTGGTPGKQNSVFARMPDNIGPRLLAAIPLNAAILVVTFDENLDARVPLPEAFTITPPLAINAVAFSDASQKAVTLSLAEPLRPGVDYALRVENVYDCPGNRLQRDFSECTFVLPERAEEGDIVINEILFNPTATGVDFIEIYNRSAKTIDLRNWSLSNAREATRVHQTIVVEKNLLIGPNAFKVFTENADVLSGEYPAAKFATFWETNLPAFNDDEGSAALFTADGQVIDSMAYSEDMHSPFLANVEGVSLERISPTASSVESANWYSGSSTTGYATPGYVNASMRDLFASTKASVEVEPEIIQHAVAGAGFASIKFRFSQPGLMANVRIFDSAGRLVRHIAENQLLGSEGFFRWDGDRDDGSAIRIGYYMVWFQVFDTAGFVKTYRKRIVVY